jgi:hypothetical protein
MECGGRGVGGNFAQAEGRCPRCAKQNTEDTAAAKDVGLREILRALYDDNKELNKKGYNKFSEMK